VCRIESSAIGQERPHCEASGVLRALGRVEPPLAQSVSIAARATIGPSKVSTLGFIVYRQLTRSAAANSAQQARTANCQGHYTHAGVVCLQIQSNLHVKMVGVHMLLYQRE
jgi:hypothetical protein